MATSEKRFATFSLPIVTLVTGIDSEKGTRAEPQDRREFKPMTADERRCPRQGAVSGRRWSYELFKTSKMYDSRISRRIRSFDGGDLRDCGSAADASCSRRGASRRHGRHVGQLVAAVANVSRLGAVEGLIRCRIAA